MKLNLVIDIDGVMTTGQFLYSSKGKEYKIFGAHDADGLKLVRDKLNIFFITADKKGLPISRKRIKDMGYKLEVVSEGSRYDYIKKKFGFANTIFIGDGIFDAPVLRDCLFGIAPANARIEAKNWADYVTPSKSAEGAVCDACIKINKIFFGGRR
jgi:3-deoxy-D-manno-octulosonate 8-phosphate phosphatase (KDO 8-P phosphatase)